MIIICGIPYTITEHTDAFNIDTHFGQVDFKKAEIRLNKDLSDAVKQEALVHEIVHAVLVHIGRSDLSEDETFVQSFANAINQTFTVNEIDWKNIKSDCNTCKVKDCKDRPKLGDPVRFNCPH